MPTHIAKAFKTIKKRSFKATSNQDTHQPFVSMNQEKSNTSALSINNSSRRDFFIKLTLASAGTMLPPLVIGCDDEKAYAAGTGKIPFSIWEEILQVLEQSPDHLLARRNRLIQEGDLSKMRDFIVNDVALLPSDDYYFRYLGTGSLYGTEMALRCGMATPREKAELLKDMVQQAGYEAEVVYERVSLSEKEVKAILFRPLNTSFSPPVSENQYKRWLNALEPTQENGKVSMLEDIESQATALATPLLNDLTDDQKKTNYQRKFHFGASKVPTVQVWVENKPIFLHIFDPEVPFGELHPSNTGKVTNPAKAYTFKDEDIVISLTGINSMEPSKKISFVQGTWKASQLVGNQIQLRFLKNMGFEELATKTIAQISSFTPCLSLQDINQDKAFMEANSFLGEPFSLDGKSVIPENKEMFILPKDEGPSTPIASLTIKAFPKSFPLTEVQIMARDSEGRQVEGLQASNFQIEDNDLLVNGWLQQNRVAPRILLMYDTSISMPLEYRGKGIAQFLKETQEAIMLVYPAAQIKLQKTSSNIYTSYFKACQTSIDLILYATDGHNNDTYDPAYSEFYEQAPATLFLNVYNIEAESFQNIVQNTRSQSIFAKDQSATITQIKTYIDELELPAYIFNYHSFQPLEEHRVTCCIKKTELSASDTFRFPPVNGNKVGNALIGLYLDIKIGKDREIQKTLAGYDPKTLAAGEISVDLQEEVHELLLGSCALAFEREGAPLAIRLSEFLKCRLADRNWYEPYLEGDLEKAIAKLGEGNLSYASLLLSAMQPLHNPVTDSSITYPKRFRIGVLKFKPALYSKESRVSFDFLQTSKYQTIMRDGGHGFARTAEKTAQLALLEAQLFTESTYALLNNKALLLGKKLRADERYNSETLGNDYYYFYYTVYKNSGFTWFAQDTSTRAYWRMDPSSGELYGILPDQTGGGGEGQLLQLQELQRVVDEYERISGIVNLGMAVAGVGSVPVGVVAAYGLTLVKLYAIATEAVILMESANMDEQVKKAIAELACNVYKEIHYAGFGSAGATLSGIENLIAAMGGSYSFVKC